MAKEMLEHVTLTNKLREDVEAGKLSARKKVGWMKLDASDAIPAFPKMTEAHLRAITFGVYQIRQARHYTDEHLNDGKYYVSSYE